MLRKRSASLFTIIALSAGFSLTVLAADTQPLPPPSGARPPPPPPSGTQPPPYQPPPTSSAPLSKPEAKLVSEFTDLAGSPDNATSLIRGLRTGSSITLMPEPHQGARPATFDSPTKPMGYGNVKIALSLARTQLAQQGNTNPTPVELQGALMGTSGPGGTQTGVLQMRADGMGWGQIANSMGVKLGPVMSGKQVYAVPVNAGGNPSVNPRVTTASGSPGSSSGVTTAAGGQGNKHSGITTASGARGSTSGVTTAAGAQGGKHGGITTASGTTVGGSGQGAGNAYGHSSSGSVVNAAGGQAGAVGGGGAGHGKGGGKP